MNVKESFSRAAEYYDRHATLQREIATQVAALCLELNSEGVSEVEGSVKSGSDKRNLEKSALEKRGEAIRSILDLGAGTGFLTAELLRCFPRAKVVALDISPGMVEYGRKQCPKAEWVCGDALCFDSQRRFDLIASSSSIQWMQPFDRLFSSLRERLTEGGLLVFSAMTEGTLRRLREVRGAIAPEKPPTLELPRAADLSAAVERAGFKVQFVRREAMEKSYSSVRALLEELQQLGVNGSNRESASRLTRVEVERLIEQYESRFCVNGEGVVEEFVVTFFVAVRLGDGHFSDGEDSLKTGVS